MCVCGLQTRPPDELGFTNTEPAVYEKWVPADQVEVWVEKTPFHGYQSRQWRLRAAWQGAAAQERLLIIGVEEVSIQPNRGGALVAGLFALGVALNEWKFLMGLVVGIGIVQAAGWLQIHWLTGVITVGVI